MLITADYHPPYWLRNPHLQAALGSSPMRRARAAQAFAACGANTTEHLLDGGDGVRLQGFHSAAPGQAPRGLVVLFHGWEGSVESSYMLATAAKLLSAGFEVFRLNFRDHGDTHHLNEALFHSNRLAEVVHAVSEIARRFPARPLLGAGYSLGGNFALRVAHAAPRAGIALAHVAAVCPVLDPRVGLEALETAPPFYHWHFMRKWRKSLKRKRRLFPQQHRYDDRQLEQGMRALTADLVVEHAGFDNLDAYLDGYAITGTRLADLKVPASLLSAADDPIIPVHEFHALALPVHSRVEIARWGGHCGFLEDASLAGFAERWVTARLLAAQAEE